MLVSIRVIDFWQQHDHSAIKKHISSYSMVISFRALALMADLRFFADKLASGDATLWSNSDISTAFIVSKGEARIGETASETAGVDTAMSFDSVVGH